MEVRSITTNQANVNISIVAIPVLIPKRAIVSGTTTGNIIAPMSGVRAVSQRRISKVLEWGDSIG